MQHCLPSEVRDVYASDSIQVVDDFSSKLDLSRTQETVESIDANHMEMARCDSEDDARYRQISGVLKQFIRTELSRRAEDTTTGTGQAPKLGVTQTAFELPSEPKSIATMADMNNSAQM